MSSPTAVSTRLLVPDVQRQVDDFSSGEARGRGGSWGFTQEWVSGSSGHSRR